MSDDIKIREINNHLWDVVNSHIGPEDKSVVFALSGCMIKTALELYTVILEDEDIIGVLDKVCEDIPKLRANMREQIGERTLH